MSLKIISKIATKLFKPSAPSAIKPPLSFIVDMKFEPTIWDPLLNISLQTFGTDEISKLP